MNYFSNIQSSTYWYMYGSWNNNH